MVPLGERCLEIGEIQGRAARRAPAPSDALACRAGTEKGFSRDYVTKVDCVKFFRPKRSKVKSRFGIVAVEWGFVAKRSGDCSD